METNTYIIKNCDDNAAGELTIPDTYNSLPIVKIGDNAFKDCDSLTSITIGNSVTEIGEGAFMNCTSLDSVFIPESVTEIGYYAFYNCEGLAVVDIENISAWCNISFNYEAANPLIYAGELYLNGNSITDLVIPEDVSVISDYAFKNCLSIKTLSVSDKTKYIGKNAFAFCENLTSVDLGSGVAVIDEASFRSCSALTDIHISKGLSVIGYGAFLNCTSLENVYVDSFANWCNINFNYEASNPMIYAENFYIENILIKDIVVPQGTMFLKPYVFYGFNRAQRIYIPTSVVSISPNFYYSDNYTEIYCYKNSVAEKFAVDNGYFFQNVVVMPTFKSSIDYHYRYIITKENNLTEIDDLFTFMGTNFDSSASNINTETACYGTTSTISFYDGSSLLGTYTLIVDGDLTGDSICNVLDAFEAEKASAKKITLSSAAIYAAKGNTVKFSATDYQKVVNKALNQ